MKRLAIFLVAGLATGAASAQTVEVSTPQDTCAEGTTLRLWEIRDRGRTGRGLSANADCRWTIADLRAGTYQIDLVAPTGSAGSSRPFVVRHGQVTRVVVQPATVRVAGLVSIAGNPAAGARLEFHPSDRE